MGKWEGKPGEKVVAGRWEQSHEGREVGTEIKQKKVRKGKREAGQEHVRTERERKSKKGR